MIQGLLGGSKHYPDKTFSGVCSVPQPLKYFYIIFNIFKWSFSLPKTFFVNHPITHYNSCKYFLDLNNFKNILKNWTLRPLSKNIQDSWFSSSWIHVPCLLWSFGLFPEKLRFSPELVTYFCFIIPLSPFRNILLYFWMNSNLLAFKRKIENVRFWYKIKTFKIRLTNE